ncbi:chemotaxis protein CheB [Rhodocytophaga aerolata]|uniref:protein-glutamate methylesterase n=1 Tax=Rhodocytophaga aerolata TaxID=455078 RepID=A0ABT8R2W8_9BACT|nr:chemotaxis protein CheB [Rhodocytophaga aerolata]MDO1445628.1 chemotaxis protein CheB [Rhodocytophaga aerolata]
MSHSNFYIVGVGASAGGYQAIWEFFSNIPPDSGAAFVIVQHLNREYRSIADKLLAKHTSLSIYWAQHNQPVEMNAVYILPENKVITIRNRHLYLRKRLPDEKINLTVDIFFESLARDVKEKAVGIIMSGLGSDGAHGVQAIHHYGGHVMVQEPNSTVFNSMPKMAINADSPDFILPPASLANALVKCIGININS